MDEIVEVFVGSDRSQLLAVAVLDHSIRRHTTAAVRVLPLMDLDLPEPKDLRQGSRTNFSFARFAIPELNGYSGRALYLDADMLVFRDIRNLWSLPFNQAQVIIQEELPEDLSVEQKPGAPSHRRKQTSVMLIDCERARWDVHEIVSGLDGRYDYAQLMYELCILPEEAVSYTIPFAWNSLEHYDQRTCLLHYTDMNTQPWVSPNNVYGRHWLRELRLALEVGFISWENVQKEIALGYMRPSLREELDEMPHEAGFDTAAVQRYESIDKAAGFVKHAEVYARKKRRAAESARF